MVKIRKNLTDADMLGNYQEKITFENDPAAERPVSSQPRQSSAARKQEDLNVAYFTPELREKVGKALLELKLQLFKEGIVDYTIKVARQGHQITLTAQPVAKKTK